MRNALSSLFLWFYCLDIPDAALLVLGITVLFLLVHRRLSGKRWWKYCVGIMLLGILLAVTFSTVFTRAGGDPLQHNFIPFHSYREVLSSGNIEIYRSNFMNVVLFYPAGLLATSILPRKWPGWCRCILVVLVLAAMSAGIEYIQYHYALGQCEIDDVIHNTAGALLGSMAALLLPRLGACFTRS